MPRMSIKGQGHILKRLMKIVFENYLWQFIAVIVCIVVTAYATIQSSTFTRDLVDVYIAGIQKGTKTMGDLANAMIPLGCILALGVAASYIRQRLMVSVGQVVQYVSAHDNYTLWDKLAAVGRRGDYDCPDADLLAQNRMTAGIYLTCQGLPFMQAGEEWGRTKYGDHNSYKGPLTTNRLDWTRAHRPEFAALTAFYRGMLAIRRAYPRLSGAAGEPEPFILALPGWLIGFVPENDGTATVGQLAVYYNPERTRQWASLPAGTWRKVSDGVHAGVTPFGPCFRDALELAPTSVTVLVAE